MNKNNSYGGVSLLGLLLIAFIVLKLTNAIGWSWVWVFAPMWGPLAVVVVILLVCLIVQYVKLTKEEKNHGR